MIADTKQIPLMRPKLPDATQLLPYLREIDANRWYSNFGPLEQRLTGRFAAQFGVTGDHVVCLSNATTALSISLAALTGDDGRYCLMPSFTFVATAQAALAAGLTPYFLDVDPATWRLDNSVVCDVIARLGSDVAAVMVVAPFGAPIDIAPWDRLTEENRCARGRRCGGWVRQRRSRRIAVSRQPACNEAVGGGRGWAGDQP